MCLAKICIFILTSKWEGSKFRSHGHPEFWNFLSVQCYVLYCCLSAQSPVLLPQPSRLQQKKKFSHKDKRIVTIIGYHPPGVPALLKHFCGSLWAVGKCWARDLGFHSQQYTLPGTDTFPLISFIYSWTPLSPLTRFSRPFTSFTVTYPVKIPSSIFFSLSFLTQISLSTSGNWNFQNNPLAWLTWHCSQPVHSPLLLV